MPPLARSASCGFWVKDASTSPISETVSPRPATSVSTPAALLVRWTSPWYTDGGSPLKSGLIEMSVRKWVTRLLLCRQHRQQQMDGGEDRQAGASRGPGPSGEVRCGPAALS